MKTHKFALGAAALLLSLALAGCGGDDAGSGVSGGSGTLAEGSSPVVNGSVASSGLEDQQEEQEQLHMMTIDETIDYFNRLSPSSLGLSGESMEEYEVYPTAKAIPVDNLPCMKITVYAKTEEGTNAPLDTFLVARDGTAVYRLVDGQAEKLELN